jgi:predicted MFS family arabinose efflux permease
MAGLAAIAYIQPASAFWAACLLYIVFQGLWPLLSVASTDLAAELAPFGQGAAIGLFNAIAAIASATGAVAGGLIADRVGNTAVPLFAALAIAAALVMLSFTRPSRADARGSPAAVAATTPAGTDGLRGRERDQADDHRGAREPATAVPRTRE